MAEGRIVPRAGWDEGALSAPVIASGPSGSRAPCNWILEAAVSICFRSSAESWIVSSADILFQATQFGGAWNGNDPGLLGQQPGERDLGRRGAYAGHRPSDRRGPVGLPCLGRKARDEVAEIGFVELCVAAISPVRKPLPSGLNGTKPIPSSSRVGRNPLQVRATTANIRSGEP